MQKESKHETSDNPTNARHLGQVERLVMWILGCEHNWEISHCGMSDIRFRYCPKCELHQKELTNGAFGMRYWKTIST